MPGTYTHIALANQVPQVLRRAGAAREAVSAVNAWLKYCELGAVSPDYPYLVIGDRNARWWADRMHKGETGALLDAGVAAVASMAGEARRKGMAWLLGYASHVMADMTIHPVVELKVGPYLGHEKEHRTCEMHQDAFIFPRRMKLRLRFAEHFERGIGSCGTRTALDQDIVSVWSSMLRRVYPEEFQRNPPDFDRWHVASRLAVGKVAEEGDRLFPLARHVAVDLALVYPRENEVSPDYLEHLDTPLGKMSYEQVFDRAVASIATQSADMVAAVLGGNQYLAAGGEWDLDTGRIDGAGRMLWGEVA